MRLCRFEYENSIQIGFYQDDTVVPLKSIDSTLTANDSVLPFLPHGEFGEQTQSAAEKMDAGTSVSVDDVKLLVPIPNPSKLMLLAGNYSKHIEEGGGKAEERAKTFPYVFMKPPLTTLTNPNDPIQIPAVSPNHVDWELELGIVIGRECKGVSEGEALNYVAGYTVINDISDRKFKPNPNRADREKDSFFDWLHGKWHDTFCPMGPCVTSANTITDPQGLKLDLRVNGETEQDANTSDMVFPVAAIVEFISSFVTLAPGDVISTGTPDGVGFPKGKFLKAGDTVEAEIAGIGILKNPVQGP
ncbi:fumarylacetoacetate hydrolase family protein [Thalassoroseus pseudoceratinae]|uniref:fumarylacetoacetate hydrolase family protein n=1 Tax=Thalassoroseus pseudoceratinae TaxID=2713176 RepID=UPI0014203D76|nr:fumarylacetoacetate hydrolase family protein [Thalassoroseus pseudoceratinae]